MNKFPVTDSIIGLSTENVADLTFVAVIDYNNKRYTAKSDKCEQFARNSVLKQLIADNPNLEKEVDRKFVEVRKRLIDVGGAAAFQLANDEKYDAPLGSFKNKQLAENIKMKYYNDKL